ncbi:MAG TPA: DUF3300 domain-containing protein [Candidatus Deferrimicrobiaceae bacterium]|nr:DUF3300 domain-containing protein [Candidatus Deferrimicrobiaceae bacterium]
MYTPTPIRANFSRLLPESRRSLRPGSLLTLAITLFLTPALFAQQESNGKYPQDQSGDQSGYGQPGYTQPQPYGQQPNSQPDYPDQAYPQQSYSGDNQTENQQGYPQQTEPEQGYPQQQPNQVQALSEQQLEQLVAPIALYPDTLVAQVLTASTYPAQLAEADQWRRTQGYASSEQIAAGADAQLWDPSVKALTAFPQVLAQMVYNLQWATELGNAYYNQPQDLLQAVQMMRQRAQAAGNLRSTPQEAVNYDQGNIVLAPANPQLVYVPEYNPWAVYGQPISPYPGFSLLGAVGSFIGSSFGPLAVRFGIGIATTAFMHTPFGLLAWGLDWLAHSVLFHGSNYYSRSMTVRDWGLPHGGPRAFGRGGATWANRSYRTPGGYGRPGVGFNGTRSQGFSRTPYRRPDRDAYVRNRVSEGYSRGYQTSRGAYAGSSRGTYNSFRPAAGRPQQYARSGFGSVSYNRSPGNFGARTGINYGRSMGASRARRGSFQRSAFGGRSSSGFRSSGFGESSGKHSHSGGSHFGGGHAPKGFGGGKSFGHGHSGGGGHSGGHSHSGGGKHHH